MRVARHRRLLSMLVTSEQRLSTAALAPISPSASSRLRLMRDASQFGYSGPGAVHAKYTVLAESRPSSGLGNATISARAVANTAVSVARKAASGGSSDQSAKTPPG